MGFGPNPLGHSPDAVTAAVRATVGHGTSLAIATPLEVELAQSDLPARSEHGADALRRHRHGGDDDGAADCTGLHGPRENRALRGSLPRSTRLGTGQRRPCRRAGGVAGARRRRCRDPARRARRRRRPALERHRPGGAGDPGGRRPRRGHPRADPVLEHRRRRARSGVPACTTRADLGAWRPARLRRGDHRLPSRARRRGCSVSASRPTCTASGRQQAVVSPSESSAAVGT